MESNVHLRCFWIIIVKSVVASIPQVSSGVLVPRGGSLDIVKYCVSNLVGLPLSCQTVMPGPGS